MVSFLAMSALGEIAKFGMIVVVSIELSANIAVPHASY